MHCVCDANLIAQVKFGPWGKALKESVCWVGPVSSDVLGQGTQELRTQNRDRRKPLADKLAAIFTIPYTFFLLTKWFFHPTVMENTLAHSK